MSEWCGLVSYVLSSMGLSVLLVWPQRGPSAWVRDRLLLPRLPKSAQAMLDCYLCCSFWSGLLLSPAWWVFYHRPWCWSGCLIAPLLFWLIDEVFFSGVGTPKDPPQQNER